MKEIVSWAIVVEFADGTSTEIADMPDDVAQGIDDYLTELESEV